MREELSAGGVVVFGNAILLLRKYNGDWVLPKGRVEKGESLEQTAVREVFEESRVRGNIMAYLGKINYSFKKDIYYSGDVINKTVHWFLMRTRSMSGIPQREEGFVEVKFIHIDRAINIVKYEDERRIIMKAADYANNNIKNQGAK
jgi:8-oxo-dGTP pyrophosphatase MutT (NUDIX family)